MSYTQTMNQLADLKLNGMLQAYQQMERDPMWAERSFDERMAFIVNREHEKRADNRVRLRLKEAHFRETAYLHELIYNTDRGLNRDLVQRLTTHRWIQNHENIIITGATGTGKSYLAQALGDHACRYNFRVRYYRVPEPISDLRYGKQNKQFIRMRQTLQRQDILILDDWGLAKMDQASGYEIAEILQDRLQRRSTIVVSQFPIHMWDGLFDDKTTADAVMDRLIHTAYTIDLKGASLRSQAASDELKAFKETMIE